jgi:type II secretory pathway component GspD/PulD (secretin)
MRNGETIVLGGLLKDVKSKQIIGIPLLRDIPWIGKKLFERETIDTLKVDLLIFITARVLKEGEFTPEEIARLEKELGKDKAIKKEITKLEQELKEDKPIIKKK